MFSGIVDCVQAISKVSSEQVGLGIIRLEIHRPAHFADLHLGDSIAVDGVCLTVEKFDEEKMVFAIGEETQKILWPTRCHRQFSWVPGALVNLERSLRFGDRVHGHLVAGHVDSIARVVRSENLNGSWILDMGLPEALQSLIWKKGSVAVNGVSLTVNEVTREVFSVCLVPETQARTNLAKLHVGDWVNLEADWLARAYLRQLTVSHPSHPPPQGTIS